MLAEPVFNQLFVLFQVNPLTANPLNGLAYVGNTVSGFTTSINQMSEMVARMMKDKMDSSYFFPFIFQ